MALWAGRFSKEIDAGVNAFNSSIAFDARMYRHDIQGSIAHATMLGDCGIISKEDSKTIIEGLTAILADLDSGKLEFDPNAEDIHMFVEAELTKRYGDVGKRLHTPVPETIRWHWICGCICGTRSRRSADWWKSCVPCW